MSACLYGFVRAIPFKFVGILFCFTFFGGAAFGLCSRNFYPFGLEKFIFEEIKNFIRRNYLSLHTWTKISCAL